MKGLETIMIQRASQRMLAKVPENEAAYHNGRKTTEHLLLLKLL